MINRVFPDHQSDAGERETYPDDEWTPFCRGYMDGYQEGLESSANHWEIHDLLGVFAACLLAFALGYLMQ